MKSKKLSPDDIIISDKKSYAFPEAVTSKEVREDIDFLIYTLSNGYGGKNYVPGDTFSDSIKTLKKISEGSSLEVFHDKVDEALYLIPDNHLYALYKGRTSMKRESMEREGRVGKNNIKDPKKLWEVRNDKIGKKNVLYVSLTSYPPSNSERWNGFLKSIYSKLSTADSIVLDFRGNKGGDDTKGVALAKMLYGHDFEHPIKKQYVSRTPEALALAVNSTKNEIMDFKFRNEKIPDYLLDDLRMYEDLYASSLNKEFPIELIRPNKGGGNRTNPITGYTKPIYILMDYECESSCEFVIASLKWHPSVKTVGENSFGIFHFSNAGLAILPNSKIRVWIPSQYSEYYDNRFIERIGLFPDIEVPDRQDAYEEVKKLIKAQ